MVAVLRWLVRIVALAIVPVSAAVAAPIAVSNASFETPAVSPMGTFASLTPPGWSIYDPAGVTGTPDTDFGVWWPLGFFDYASGAQDGIQCGVVYADLAPGSGIVGLQQMLPATLARNTRVSFEVYVGDPTSYSDAQLAGFPGYRVELVAGAHDVVSDDDTATQEGQFRPVRATLPIGSAHPGLGQPLVLRLLNRNAATGAEVDFDAVSVEATPAPIETYLFTIAHDGGSLAGVLVYDRERSAATQQLGRDASVAITSATGDLAPFANVDWDGSNLNAAGGVLTLIQSGGTGNFIQFQFGASLSLDQPLPVGVFQSHNSSAYLASVAVVGQGEAGALFTLPEPASGGLAALLAIATLRARRCS